MNNSGQNLKMSGWGRGAVPRYVPLDKDNETNLDGFVSKSRVRGPICSGASLFLQQTPRMGWSDSITDSRNMSLSKLWETVKGREDWCAAVPGVTGSDVSEGLGNNNDKHWSHHGWDLLRHPHLGLPHHVGQRQGMLMNLYYSLPVFTQAVYTEVPTKLLIGLA